LSLNLYLCEINQYYFEMSSIIEDLHAIGKTCLYWRHSALAKYHGTGGVWPLQIVTDANLVELSRIFTKASFSSLPRVSMCVLWKNREIQLFCVDTLNHLPRAEFSQLDLLYDPVKGSFLDRYSVYFRLREKNLLKNKDASFLDAVVEAACLVSRYPYHWESGNKISLEEKRELSADRLRQILSYILLSGYAAKGLELMKESGFIDRYLPELGALSAVRHDKDFHPEGDGWKHSLEALYQRKRGGLRLSLALLLHDIGKTVAGRNGQRAFDGHSELGTGIAARFLRRLGFDRETEDVVVFLIRHHMFPGALHRMSVSKVERLMGSTLYPMLLEVYRADLLATWADDSAYHEAYRQYKKYLKNSRNPYRDARGIVRKR